MDMEIEIKEEPVWLDETENTSLDTYMDNNVDKECIKVESHCSIIPKLESESFDPGNKNHVMVQHFQPESAMVQLKEETKLESTEPGPSRVAADIKEEIFVEEHVTYELVPCIKGEKRVENPAVPCQSTSSDGLNSLKSATGLKAQYVTHIKKWLLPCIICGQGFTSSSALNKHSTTTHRDARPFCCSLCGKAFKTTIGLRDHSRRHTDERSFCCSVCGNFFNFECDLKKHSQGIHRIRSSALECSVCGKTFQSLYKLRRHTVVHGDDRPFPCSMCGMVFERVGALIEHTAIHSDDTPFLCSICRMTFTNIADLETHGTTCSRSSYVS